MSSAKALKKKIAKRAKQKKNIQVKNSIRLKQKVTEPTEQSSVEPQPTNVTDPAHPNDAS